MKGDLIGVNSINLEIDNIKNEIRSNNNLIIIREEK